MSSVVNTMIQSGNYTLLFDVIKAFRNGVVFGVKVRAPHTLLMSLVWSRGTLQQTLTKIYQMSKQHGMNLGKTAVVFKLLHALLTKVLNIPPHTAGTSPSPIAVIVTALAGFVAGSLFWGESNPVNIQVNMYLLSRILSGLLFLLISKYSIHLPQQSFRCFAGLMWAAVLVLFTFNPEVLQSSLQASMGYIYRESTKYTSLYDLLLVNSPNGI
jgi:peroxisomal membrane protein 4